MEILLYTMEQFTEMTKKEEKLAMMSALMEITSIVKSTTKVTEQECEVMQKKLLRWLMGLKQYNKVGKQ